MATYTPLPLDEAQAAGRAFGLEVRAVVPVPAGSVNSNYRLEVDRGGPFFARIYEEQDRVGAEAESRLLDHLASQGVATPRPVPRADGTGFTAVTSSEGRPIALFPWRSGEILCQARVTPEVAGKVGEKLAETHRAGATFGEKRPGRFRIADMRVRLQRIAEARDPALRALAPQIAARLDRAEKERNPDLPQGVIHGDLFRDNVLWQGSELAALLDFESACDGSWVYDLMVTVLAWCYGDDLDERLARAMFAGYSSVRRLTPAERDALPVEGRIAALRFTVTRITDFAMRPAIGERVMKDYRRFWARHERIDALGAALGGWLP
jgi:homoserine kinase type II